MLQMELVFLPGAAHRVYDLFCPEDVTRLPDGRFFVSARWPSGGFLVSMLLGFGSSVAVLNPVSYTHLTPSIIRGMAVIPSSSLGSTPLASICSRVRHISAQRPSK